MPAFLHRLTPRRRLAAIVAIIWAVIFFAVVLPIALGISPKSWQPVWGIVTVGLNSFSTAVVAVELVRLGSPRVVHWDDSRHFLAVNVLWAAFFALEITGYVL